MKKTWAIVAAALAVSNWCCAQAGGSNQTQGTPALVITNGPVVENVTDTTAQIAWSTNVSSSTIVHYGTDALDLNGVSSMPWGALTHRVQLKNLKPDTVYYFKVESGQGVGAGTEVQTAESLFQTKPAGAQSGVKDQKPTCAVRDAGPGTAGSPECSSAPDLALDWYKVLLTFWVDW
ncbi:MAG TPA: fibronectin type III domain-containing protein [Candidatus Solibacter sp.]|jgi:hypothetical protein|nr:fibronectin type III domain-containing protein [Candidatus Solibacter sp.]